MPARPASRSRSTGASTARPRPRIRRPAARSARPEDYGEASERLVSRIAQQAAPRVATLIGKPPTFLARSPGQVAAGVSVPMEPPVDPVTATAMAAALVRRAAAASTPAAQPQEAHVKVMVAPVTGAPSDGNRQLYSGMRRALGSSKIVIVDAAGADVFTVIGNVNLTAIDEQRGQLVIKWLVKDPAGRNVGDLEQSNPVPLAATKGTWAGLRRHCRDGGFRRRARTAGKGDQSAATVNLTRARA